MRIRDNLSPVFSSLGKSNVKVNIKAKVGKVYGVVNAENTPTKEMFEKVGGFNAIGTIFYLEYEQAKNITGSNDNEFLDSCDNARPLNPQYQYYPLKGELVSLVRLPAPLSQVKLTNPSSLYYSNIVNIWNTPQQNSLQPDGGASLGLNFVENPNVRNLIAFEGDYIVQGRQGNALRFSTTTRSTPNNEWSTIGNEIDPITILTNGLAYDPSKQYYIEQINKDLSSIYLTSAQKIPLQTDKTGILNNLTNPLNVPDYFNAQAIINSDRIVINSKRDEVMIFAKTNIELNTKNIINLNADERVHLNSNAVFLGPYTNVAPQPVLLGYETIRLFQHLQETLTRLAMYLSSAVSAPEGAPILGLTSAGRDLIGDMKKVCDLLEKIPSQKVFTV